MSGIDGSGADCGGAFPAQASSDYKYITSISLKSKLNWMQEMRLTAETVWVRLKMIPAPEFIPHRTNMMLLPLSGVMIRMWGLEIRPRLPYGWSQITLQTASMTIVPKQLQLWKCKYQRRRVCF